MFENKVILITGGTGSFGRALVEKLIDSHVKEIRIFSRDEKKQDEMRRDFNSTKLKFYIGDIRDIASLQFPVMNVDYIFHAAALKQVPSCEFYPEEAIKTNALGTANIIDVAIRNAVKKIVCLSTDKAVYPINAMGMSKGLMEKISIAKSRIPSKTIINITRYGNVIASRGSVIPLFYEKIKKNQDLTITNPNMTRFMMTLDDAIDLVLYAFKHGKNGDIFVKKSPSATILNISKVMINLYGNSKIKTKIIGSRHGEKLHETLLSVDEIKNCIENANYFIVKADNRDLNYSSYYDVGQEDNNNLVDYSSDNTKILNFDELKSLIKKSLKI